MWLDCIFLGEVWGGEVLDMFNVMNIGYEGLFIIVYVNILCDVLMCMENMVNMVGLNLLFKMIW